MILLNNFIYFVQLYIFFVGLRDIALLSTHITSHKVSQRKTTHTSKKIIHFWN